MDVRQMMGIISPQLHEAERRVKDLEAIMEVLRQIDKQKLVVRKDEEWAQQLRDREAEIKLAKQRVEDDLNAFRQEKQRERNVIADKFDKDRMAAERKRQHEQNELARLDQLLAQRKNEIAAAEQRRDEVLAVAERIKQRNQNVLDQIERLGV